MTHQTNAQRLAVALGLKVMPYPSYGVEKHSVIVSRRVPATDPESLVAYDGPEVVELYGNAPYAATRLAIVRAIQHTLDGEDASLEDIRDANSQLRACAEYWQAEAARREAEA